MSQGADHLADVIAPPGDDHGASMLPTLSAERSCKRLVVERRYSIDVMPSDLAALPLGADSDPEDVWPLLRRTIGLESFDVELMGVSFEEVDRG